MLICNTHACPFGCPIAERVCFVKLPFYPGLKRRFCQDYHFVVNFSPKKNGIQGRLRHRFTPPTHLKVWINT